MDLILLAGSYGKLAIIYAVPFFAILGLIVIAHELGHFLVARLCGAAVTVFSFGMGPELIGFTDRYGTRWRVSVVPLGGYVRFADATKGADAPEAASPKDLAMDKSKMGFDGQPVGKKMAIVAAGPIASFLLAIAIFSCQAYIFGEKFIPPRIEGIAADSPAESAGFKVGDMIKRIDDTDIYDFPDILQIVSLRPDEPLTFYVERDAKTLVIVAKPRSTLIDTPTGPLKVGRLGISSAGASGQTITYPSVLGALSDGLSQTWKITHGTLDYIFLVVTGRATTDQLSGPVGIAQVSHSAASVGLAAMFQLAAILSVSLGFMNMLPIPMLDGGHLVIYLIEAIRGRQLNARFKEIGLRIGLAFILALTLFVTTGDLRKLYNLNISYFHHP